MNKLLTISKGKFLGFALGVLMVSGSWSVAHAVDISCDYTTPSIQVNTIGSITCGPVTFSSFVISDTVNYDPNLLFLTSAIYNSGTGIIDLNFNPNFAGNTPPTAVQDFHLTYVATVGSGFIVSIDGSIGGIGGTMQEIICTVGVNSSTGACAPTGTQLAAVSVVSGQMGQPIISNLSMPTGGTLYVFKDVGMQCSTGSCGVSSFGQSYHLNKIPEPASMLLFGFGLVGLGVYGRKRLSK